jgi:magnesium chelatase family protein
MYNYVYSLYSSNLIVKKVKIEVSILKGLPSFTIVGLPDSVVKESKDRVISAIKNSGFKFPLGRIIVNLSPANIKKCGSHFDLAIAVAILKVIKKIKNIPNDLIFSSEISLKGDFLTQKNIPIFAIYANEKKLKLISSKKNKEVLEKIDGNYYLFDNLKELIESFNEKSFENNIFKVKNIEKEKKIRKFTLDDIYGQYLAKKAIITAVSGFHSIILFGTPGSGKTMLAEKIKNMFLGLNKNKILENYKINSISNSTSLDDINFPPFRYVHPTISTVGLLGTTDSIGEITLANNGVLFLDEICEFSRSKIESLRQPLSFKKIAIARKDKKVIYPSNFMLLATTNLCPCGNYLDEEKVCNCTENMRKRYLSKISKAILDRIDIQINVKRVKIDREDSYKKIEEFSYENIVKMIENSLYMQKLRKKESKDFYNSLLNNSEINLFCNLDKKDELYLKEICEKFKINLRGYFSILKVSRTLADMKLKDKIEISDLNEAISLRYIDFHHDIFN